MLKILKNGNKKISIAIMSSSVVLSVQYFILIFFQLTNTNVGSVIQLFAKIIAGIFFLIAFPYIIKNYKKSVLYIYFFIVILYLISFLIFKNNRVFMIDNALDYFVIIPLTFIYALCLSDYLEFKKILKISSIIIFVFGVATSLIVFLGIGDIGAYSMSLSYYLLIPAIISLNEFFNKYRFSYLMIFMLAFLFILSLGSRGPLIPIVTFVFLKLIKSNSNSFKNMIQKILLISIFFGLAFLYRPILNTLSNFLDYLNLNSRTIRLLLDNLLYLSGRDNLYISSLNLIKDNPIFGYGIFGDRYLLGTYVHNIILELFIDFGLIIGSLIIFVIVYKMIIRIFQTKNIIKYEIFIMWFSIGVIPLFVSGSYLTSANFWVFIGILFSKYSRETKKGILR